MDNKSLKFSTPNCPESVDLYIRVSTTEQAREGYSIGEQEARLRSFCQAMGFRIHRVAVDPGYSGSSMNRPGLNEVIDDANARRISRVIVWRLDRLSRSQKDTLCIIEDYFLKNDVYFTSMLESFDTGTAFGRAVVGILAAFAQLERENIKERTAMGRTARIAQGHYSASHPPFGYRFKLRSNDLEVSEFEAVLVQEIFSDFLSGVSIGRITDKIVNHYGNAARAWNGTTIRRILSNPVYIGKVRHNDELFDGIHDPIISAEDFSLANSILNHNREIKKQCKRSRALLTGIIYCGDCGARMQAKRITSGYELRRYVCYSVSKTSKVMIRSSHCTNRIHPFTLEELDDIIIHEVEKLAMDQKYLESVYVSERKPKTDKAASIKNRLSEISKQYDKLLDLYQTGVVELADVSERLATLKKEREVLQATLSPANGPAEMTIEQVKSTALSFKAAIDINDEEQSARIIRALIDRVTVLNDQIEILWSFS